MRDFNSVDDEKSKMSGFWDDEEKVRTDTDKFFGKRRAQQKHADSRSEGPLSEISNTGKMQSIDVGPPVCVPRGAAEGVERGCERQGWEEGRQEGSRRKGPVGEREEEVFIAEIPIAGSNALAQEGFATRGFGFAIRGFARGRTAA